MYGPDDSYARSCFSVFCTCGAKGGITCLDNGRITDLCSSACCVLAKKTAKL